MLDTIVSLVLIVLLAAVLADRAHTFLRKRFKD